jgi:hypothetical protein
MGEEVPWVHPHPVLPSILFGTDRVRGANGIPSPLTGDGVGGGEKEPYGPGMCVERRKGR